MALKAMTKLYINYIYLCAQARLQNLVRNTLIPSTRRISSPFEERNGCT